MADKDAESMKMIERLRHSWGGWLGATALTAFVATAGLAQTSERGSRAASPDAVETTVSASAVTDHVVVISIDGLRPDAIRTYEAETIQRLMREGRFTLEASTIVPSKTLPSHTSMVTGVGPEDHGVLWNSEDLEQHGHIDTPTMFGLARARGLHTAAFFSKSKFQHLMVDGTLDYAQAPDGGLGKWLAGRTASDVEAYLQREAPNLLFVHFGEPDFAGHVFGWMSTPYGWAVDRADDAVERVVEAADEAYGAGNYTVILTADHGGHDRDHGSDDPRDVTIPWITWGEGVSPGRILPSDIHTTDTAATVLRLLGVGRAPAPSIGTAVVEAYDALGAVAERAAAGAAQSR